MAPTKRTKISGDIETGTLKVGADYRSEIIQEITNLEDEEVKIIPFADGKGLAIATRNRDQVTIAIKLVVRDGIFRKKILTNILEINDEGVYENGRKI
jgi:hypothetical protein